MTTDIEDVIEAAQRHGVDSDPGHEVGDLQNVLRAAWELMTEEQRLLLITSNTVQIVLEG